MKSAFYGLHPSVSFAYFVVVLAFTMIFSHPVCLFISFMCGALYAFRLFGRAAFCRRLSVILALMLFTAVLNPLFSHRGVTILAYLPGGNPLTAESLIYGLAAALMPFRADHAVRIACYNYNAALNPNVYPPHKRYMGYTEMRRSRQRRAFCKDQIRVFGHIVRNLMGA